MHGRIGALLASLALALAGTFATAGAAQAHHNAPETKVGGPGECGTTTISTSWPTDEHKVDSARLVVQAAGEQHEAAIGEAITVGPFDTAEETIKWRVWGGGERDYDQPPLANLDALLAHLEGGGTPLDKDAPGVAWHEKKVNGCESKPSPKPTPAPTGKPKSDCDAYVDSEAWCDPDVKDYDCDDIPGAFHPVKLVDPGKDPFGLDADKDGLGCEDANGGGGGKDDGKDDKDAKDKDDDKDGLPVTGTALSILGGVGAGALALGTALFLVGRRRRTTFTTS